MILEIKKVEMQKYLLNSFISEIIKQFNFVLDKAKKWQ